jgi:hypothetical protein
MFVIGIVTQIGLMMAPYTCILEMWIPNLDWNTDCPEVSFGFSWSLQARAKKEL